MTSPAIDKLLEALGYLWTLLLAGLSDLTAMTFTKAVIDSYEPDCRMYVRFDKKFEQFTKIDKRVLRRLSQPKLTLPSFRYFLPAVLHDVCDDEKTRPRS